MILAGRILVGGVAAVFGLNHFTKADEMTGWARSKGVPAARLAVAFSGGLLIFAGLGIITYSAPVLSAFALISFIVVSSVMLHDFWNMAGDDKQDNMINFMKNLAFIGGLLLFAGIAASGMEVGYAAGVEILT